MNADEYARLRHHGDVDAAAGLVDFAVNVRGEAPPAWLRERLVGALDQLGLYPSAADDLRAREAVAGRHGCSVDNVLVLNGSAEGFALLPRLRPTLAAVVHPSFTEPEVVLRDAGVPVVRVGLDQADGFTLRPERVPEDADMVVVGNPTNPTSVLHPADAIRSLARPGRIVVVDEAFMDAVPGEPDSVAGEPGLLVLRSLTKMWALPGLRAGYALGDPGVVARLAQGRPQWPVGALALEAVAACCGRDAVAEGEAAAVEFAGHRRFMVDALREVSGVEVIGSPVAPFLLLESHLDVRSGLIDRGFAVRRGDTFPGLTARHIRVAVRPPAQSAALIAAVRAELEVRV